jgi:RimJ/RimL family protein N-acetyltransferase
VQIFELTSKRLRLVLQTPDQVLAWIEALPSEIRAQVSESWIEKARRTQPGDYWSLGFEIRSLETSDIVGNCAFKGPPDIDRVVELAYGIEPEHQSKGYATESARTLARFAFETGEVSCVRAHTMPDNKASQRVLAKCGFERLGIVEDPEDGLVERWELRPGTIDNDDSKSLA